MRPKKPNARAQSIEWHKKCLVNATSYIRQERHKAESTLTRVKELEEDLEFYAKQIAEAERRGMSAFDRDRLLVKTQAIRKE